MTHNFSFDSLDFEKEINVLDNLPYQGLENK